MMIVDAHVHLSLHKGNARSLAESKDVLLREMRQHGIDRAIVIPDNKEGQANIAGLENARALIDDAEPLALLGSPDVLAGRVEEARRYEQLLEKRTIHGLKLFPGHEPYFPTDRRCLPFYAVCQEQQLPVVFHTGENPGDPDAARYNDPRYIVEVAEKYPLLKVVITHFFWPRFDYCYQVTRDTPNIYFEIAGTADDEVVRASGGIGVVRDVLARTIHDRPAQVMLGSDWPMCRMQDHLDLVSSLELDQTARNRVLGENAAEIYELPA
jgi:predicted TIM-barrel fold metal-dependent hydrolase